MIKINKVRLYPNGYLFSDQKLEGLPEHYDCDKIQNKFYYYFDKDAEKVIENKDDYFIIIHGHYIYIDLSDCISNKDLPLYLLNLYKNNFKEFLNQLDFIGGRYSIIIGNKHQVEVYPDATGSRTNYYSLKVNIISSHANLINDLVSHDTYQLGEIAPILTYHWITTPFKDIKSTSPNFKFELFTKSRKRFFPRNTNQYKGYSHEKLLEKFSKLWEKQMDYYYQNYENIIFSLTGGADSRVGLAMSKKYLKDLRFFTYTTTEGENHKDKYTSVLSNDQYIVKELLKDLDLNHNFFYFDKKKFALNEEQKQILNKNTIKPHGRFLINFYLSSFPEYKVMHIRGTPLEIGRAYFLSRNRLNNINEIKKTFQHSMSKYKESLKQKTIDEVFDENVELFNYNENLYDYHRLDLYYWENRMGRWHSEILNETDVCFETVMPFNMRAMIDISLSYNREQRRNGFLFNELINKNYPVLNFYGKNTKLNLYEQIALNNKEAQSLIQTFNICHEDQLIEKIHAKDNSIYIPFRYLKKSMFAELNLKFTKLYGILELSVLNKYYSSNAKGYVKYQIYKNNILLLEEDISLWNIDTKIQIFNIKKDDKIKVNLVPLKNIRGESWEEASKLIINGIREIETQRKSETDIASTSPYSIII